MGEADLANIRIRRFFFRIIFTTTKHLTLGLEFGMNLHANNNGIFGHIAGYLVLAIVAWGPGDAKTLFRGSLESYGIMVGGVVPMGGGVVDPTGFFLASR